MIKYVGRFYLILFLVLTIGCSSKDNRFDSIDFIAYSWRIPNMGKEWKFHCTTYALINKSGRCELIIERFYPKSEIIYCKINISKEIIDNILYASKNIHKELDMRPKVGTDMYDGPSLKVRINKDEENKTIHFYLNNSNETKVFVKLYEFISSSYMLNKYEKIKDDSLLLKRKLEFINYSMKSDSILRPPPPPPSEVEVLLKRK